MSDAAILASPATARRQRSRFLRFSLRTLMLFALLAGAVGLLIRDWAPWVPELRLEGPHLSPDRTRAATVLGRQDGSVDVAVWNTERGRRLCTVHLAPGVVPRFQYAANSRRLAVWIGDGMFETVDLENGVSARGPAIYNVTSFSSNADRLVATDKDGNWVAYDARSGQRLFAIDAEQPVFWAGYTPRGNLLVRRSLGDFCLANLETGKCGLWVQNELFEPVFSSNEQYAVIGQNRKIKLLTVETGEVRGCDACEAAASVPEVHFSDDDKHLLAMMADEVRVIDVETMAAVQALRRRSDEFESDLAKHLNPRRVRGAGDFANENFYLDENRFVIVGYGQFTVKDARTKEILAVFGESDALKYDSAVPPDVYGALDGSRRVYVYRNQHEFLTYVNRRPERWWGIAWLPEFWMAALLFFGFAWSLARDWRTTT